MKNKEMEALLKSIYGPNLGYLYDAYDKYVEDPNSVEQSLKDLFDDIGTSMFSQTKVQQPVNTQKQTDTKKLIAAMQLLDKVRQYGHLAANINPLTERDTEKLSFTNLANYNLTEEDLQQIPAKLLWETAPNTINNGLDAYNHLMKVYTDKIAFEFDHIHDENERDWLNEQVENKGIGLKVSREEKSALLQRLLQVDTFEKFLHKTFVGQKRFSIEGLDVMVPMLDKLVELACEDRTNNLMIGMAHRGRLNVLAHVLGKPYELIFAEFHQSPNKELIPSEGSKGINYGWSGDVKYHLGADRKVKDNDQHTIHINLANNPSHLEYVNPVVQGITRASQEMRKNAGYPKQTIQSAFNVLIHGDAAFPGEGVVAETLNLSKLRGYGIGGTVHIIANNLLGFTTNSNDSRSTKYASDIAKGYEIPIIHVNADDPESCLAVITFAFNYRRKFNKDVLIDLVGYRRFGHNEMDDPVVTQPKLYNKIKNHPEVAKLYAKKLINEQIIEGKEVEEIKSSLAQDLQSKFDEIDKKEENDPKKQSIPGEVTEGLPEVDTSFSMERLKEINKSLLKRPEGFQVYPKLNRLLQKNETALDKGQKVNWALAETLAFATILADGKPIRLTGQDSERGTFAHRHMVLHDAETNETYIPLHNFEQANASFSIYNSALSEAAVLGFEYGYSVQAKEALVLWEAQFGDFVNAAQVIIDQFIAAGRAKWDQRSGLVMLLPHGHEGQGPEHSSGRIERFLQSAAENNWTVANVTTAAQYFHILRRQALISDKEEVRPLIIMTPKSLIRNAQTASTPNELSEGKFNALLKTRDDRMKKVKRLILCSGKIAVDLATALEELDKKQAEEIYIARVEQLYPFPNTEVEELLNSLPNVEDVTWVQEEPKNMGAWPVLQNYIREVIAGKMPLRYIGRPKRSSPATGDPNIHKEEQQKIIKEALAIEKGGEDSERN